MTTESICSGFKPAAVIAALLATSCRSVMVFFTNFPPYVPNGVRFAATTNTPAIIEKIKALLAYKVHIKFYKKKKNLIKFTKNQIRVMPDPASHGWS